MNRACALFLCLALSLIACSGTEQGTDKSEVVPEVHKFNIMDDYRNRRVIVYGELHLPNFNTPPYPVVVMVHGLMGVGYREKEWTRFFGELGIATFVVDYYRTRGSSMGTPSTPWEVWGALSMLSTHNKIDASRVALMGFNVGGTLVLKTVAGNPVYTNGVSPKAVVLFYGGCHMPLRPWDKTINPKILYVVGTADPRVRADRCEDRVKYDKHVDDLEVLKIDGATHMFDTDFTGTMTQLGITFEVRPNKKATEEAHAKVGSFLRSAFAVDD